MIGLLGRWKNEHRQRTRYGVPSRLPFFELAKKFLPPPGESIVLDIGPGNGDFAAQLRLKELFPKTHALLEGNEWSVKELERKGYHAAHYRAPGRLPFNDGSVAFVHLSHIVEHLPHQELYVFLKELDRVMDEGGIIVISTPLLWQRFYDDLSHIKPYNPPVFINYLTKNKENATQEPISTGYVVRELQYRYRVIDEPEWGSRFFVIDALMRGLRIIRSFLGFRRYIKNGYTLVLQKGVSAVQRNEKN